MADKTFKIINLKFLAESARVAHQKIYNNLVINKYESLDFNEKTLVANKLAELLKPIFEALGFAITMKRKP